MNISISKEEYDAIVFASIQIETEIEAASEEYAQEAGKYLNALYNVQQKYKRAREKQFLIKDLKKIVAENNSGASERYINFIARGVARKLTEGSK